MNATIVPDLNEKENQSASAAVTQRKITTKKGYLVFKRCMDILLAAVIGVVCLLPLLLIALWIRLDSPGPAIFKQQRMGQNGKAFPMYKFRSMTMEAPREMATRDFKDSNRYITKAGKILRRTSLDELPQILNILKGDMSFVGYRPVCMTEVELNGKRTANNVFMVKPGITGLAQVSGRDNMDIDQKVAYDARYVANCTLKMDVWILFKTVAVVFSGEGNK